MELERLLTVAEAAEKVGVSKTSIYNWFNCGALKFIRKGAQRLIDPDELEAASAEMGGLNKRRGHRGEQK